jgi:WhiB family redox-sensing transcriptional regulator
MNEHDDLELPTAEAWMVNAACKDAEDPDLFFTGTPEAIKEAISICHQCPVRIRCAEYAINNEITDGVWGGLTESDRRSIRRQKASRKGIPNKQH